MKRRWIGLLVALPVVVCWMVARPLAGKRPCLVAREFYVSGLVISPTGEKAVARGDGGNGGSWSRIVDLNDGSQFLVAGDANSRNIFSPDGRKLCQLNTEWLTPTGGKFNNVAVLRDVSTGHIEGQFRFASGANLYGLCWQDSEIVAQSPRQSWYFETRHLGLTRAQKRRRTQLYATLCPDGKTLHWQRVTDTMGATPEVWEFADLNSGKILWSEAKFVGGSPVGFSVAGDLVLWSGGEDQDLIIARETRTGAEKWRLRGPRSSVVALAPNQSAVYEARPNGELWRWPR